MNNWPELTQPYQRTDHKPDKRCSMVPTVLALLGDLGGQTVIDAACGSGFFTRALAATAQHVIGIDSEPRMLALAQAHPHHLPTRYVQADIFTYQPNETVDVVFAPFVLGYAENVTRLQQLVRQFSSWLRPGGRLLLIVDLPVGLDLTRFGARKQLPEGDADGAPLQIELFDQGELLVTLHAHYYRPNTVEQALLAAGMCQLEWSEPVVSAAGVAEFGATYWGDYRQNPELGYLQGVKAG